MTDDLYLSGWIAVRDTFDRAIADNEAILTATTNDTANHRTRGILDALKRARTVVQADIDRQITTPGHD